MVVVNFPHIFLEVLGNISRFLRNVNGTSGKRKHTHFFFLDVCMNSCYKLWMIFTTKPKCSTTTV